MELAREADGPATAFPSCSLWEKRSPISQAGGKCPPGAWRSPEWQRREEEGGEMIITQKLRLKCWIHIEGEKIEFKNKKNERYWGEKSVKFKTRIFLFLWVLGKFSWSLSLRQENWSCSSSVWDHRSPLVCFLPMAYCSQFAKHFPYSVSFKSVGCFISGEETDVGSKISDLKWTNIVSF